MSDEPGARKLAERSVYRGRIVNLSVDTVELPNGRRCELELIRHPGAAAVVPVLDDGNVLLVRQYRYAAGGWIHEVPAGKLAGVDLHHPRVHRRAHLALQGDGAAALPPAAPGRRGADRGAGSARGGRRDGGGRPDRGREVDLRPLPRRRATYTMTIRTDRPHWRREM
jgi:hypothetical protein